MTSPKSSKGSRRPARAGGRATSSAADSERDLYLKLDIRRLFWAMNASTCLDVKLRAYVAGDARGRRTQEYTDIDVLGVACSISGYPEISLADCKTSSKRVLERMFWLKGVSEYFSSDSAYLVRSDAVPAAARSLSTRLEIGVIDPYDYQELVSAYSKLITFGGPIDCLFTEETVLKQLNNPSSLDRRLRRLSDYLRFDYWVYDSYRNLTKLVAFMAESSDVLDGRNPSHLSMFFEACWLYSFALAKLAHHVRMTRIADVPTAVEVYVAGGEFSANEKLVLANLLKAKGIALDPKSAVSPPYLMELVELTSQLLRYPSELTSVLQYSEYLATAVVSGETASVGLAFGRQRVRPIAAKLLVDVANFLVRAGGLGEEFRAEARRRLVSDLTGGEEDSPEVAYGASEDESRLLQLRSELMSSGRVEQQLPLADADSDRTGGEDGT